MALSWEQWVAANPAPYDLQAFVDEGNRTYAGMDYYSRPQDWLDEYDKRRRANMEWQALYQNQRAGGASNEAMLTNPFVQQSGRSYWNARGTPEQIGFAPATPDWYSEAQQGNPVIGGSVQPGQTAAQYYTANPTPQGGPGSGAQPWLGTGGGSTSLPYDPNFSSINNANLAVGQGLTDLGSAINSATTRPQSYAGGGTISNFWDNSQQNNPYSSGSSATDMNSLFKGWFSGTYGSGYGM